MTKCIFKLLRREREIMCFETGTRISFFQSHASRREFLSFSLGLRDKNETEVNISPKINISAQPLKALHKTPEAQ